MGLLVVFRNLPPDIGGAASIIRNLFEFADDSYIIAGRKSRYDNNDYGARYKTLQLPLAVGSTGLWYKLVGFFTSIFLCSRAIKNQKATNILGVYRDESSLVLSYVLSLISRKPLFVYMTDLYAENYSSKFKVRIQKVIFRHAKHIFCLNTAMEEHYLQLGYSKVSVINSAIPSRIPFEKRNFEGGKFIIAFSGSIIYDRLDLLQTLVKIFGNKSEYEIRFYSPHDVSFFKSNHLFAENVVFDFFTDPGLLLMNLKQCHLLYFPLTFNNPNDQRSYLQLKTCLGTKSYEYMQTGVPILVHSPSEYFTYQFFEKAKSAILLNSFNESDLFDTVNHIKNNYSNYSEIVANAYEQLHDHSTEVNFQKLTSFLN